MKVEVFQDFNSKLYSFRVMSGANSNYIYEFDEDEFLYLPSSPAIYSSKKEALEAGKKALEEYLNK